MAVTYYAILTNIGAAKLANAAALGTTLQITQLAVGDGNGDVPVPDATRTTLVNEVRRAPLNQIIIDPANPSQIIAEQVLPETVGGWWIREMGLFDSAGSLIAISNCPPSYKPLLSQGSGRTQTVRMVLIVNNTGNVELRIDPSVVLATREYVDSAIVTAINRQDAKASVRAATTANIALSGLPTLDGVVLVAGDRVLVKNQTTGSQNGLYTVAAGAWLRTADADENAEVTPALTVSVERGTTQADTVWQLITDAPIVIGTTALVFQDITNGLARLASPAFTGNPTAPTPAQFDNDTSLATTEYVRRALGNYVFAPLSANKTLVAADAGSCYDWFGTSNGTIKLPLASTLVAGAGFRFQNISAYTLTVQVQGSDELYLGSSSAGVTSVVLGPGDSLELVHDSVRWISIGGTAALKGASVFGATMATVGFQRLPSGLVEQWTLVTLGANGKGVVTYPQTLSVLYAVHPVGIYGGIYYGVSVDNTPGLSSCALIASAAVPINAYVRIIGKL